MVGPAGQKSVLLPEVPAGHRRRIVSGMRWTVWLSAVAVPFSYGTTVLLARISPEALGTYGLLAVYSSLVMAFLYFGGDAVVIRFIPELPPGARLSFLLSYFIVISATVVPWLICVCVWRRELRHVFGGQAGVLFYVWILCLSPVLIAFYVTVAALKGNLQIAWAQSLLRVVTIGSFVTYAVLILFWRSFFADHYAWLIWLVYLGLAGLATGIGLRQLIVYHRRCSHKNCLQFFLPPGFWRYALATQQVAIVSFFVQRVDCVLILNLGGLSMLGKYVAILAIATIVPAVSSFLLDTLLPSLANLMASRNVKAASEVLRLHMRILFSVCVAVVCGLIFLSASLIYLLGPKYGSIAKLVVLMVLLVGLGTPGCVGGTLLSSVGKQQRAVWVGLGQLALYASLFFGLWPYWPLTGAVLAYGVASLVSNLALLRVAKASVPIPMMIGKDYAVYAAALVSAAFLTVGCGPMGLGTALLAWGAFVALFLLMAQYRSAEVLTLLRLFLPGRWCIASVD